MTHFSCIFSGPINSGTQALLVSPGVSVPGTLSITASEVYFEVDEDSEEYKNIDPKVGTNFIHISMISFCSAYQRGLYYPYSSETHRIKAWEKEMLDMKQIKLLHSF